MNRLLLLAALLVSGCGSIPLFSGTRYVEADARHPVMEVLCVWEAAEGRGLDHLPSRGFGGQILFFANGLKEPVKVNGDVRIYVFDEEGVDGDPSKPLHQFDFPAAVWASYLRPSNLGASYQIFIPYTRKGLHAAKCTLRVRFTPEGGLPVYSRMATIPLAGIESSATKQKSDRKILPVVAEEAEQAEFSPGIQHADFAEISEEARQLPPSKNPGIRFGKGVDQSVNLERLRRAAATATESSDESP
jgi:hypothetical protein